MRHLMDRMTRGRRMVYWDGPRRMFRGIMTLSGTIRSRLHHPLLSSHILPETPLQETRTVSSPPRHRSDPHQHDTFSGVFSQLPCCHGNKHPLLAQESLALARREYFRTSRLGLIMLLPRTDRKMDRSMHRRSSRRKGLRRTKWPCVMPFQPTGTLQSSSPPRLHRLAPCHPQ